MIKPPEKRPRQAQPRLVRLVVLRAIMFAEVFITVESIGLLFLTAIYEIKPLISQYNCLRSIKILQKPDTVEHLLSFWKPPSSQRYNGRLEKSIAYLQLCGSVANKKTRPLSNAWKADKLD